MKSVIREKFLKRINSIASNMFYVTDVTYVTDAELCACSCFCISILLSILL